MSHKAFRLITLGRLVLLDPAGREEPTLSPRRRKLALLAVLATAPQPVPRPRLVEMFWGDADEARARHSLNDTLSHFRRVLGRDVVNARQEEVSLAAEGLLDVDCVELAQEARWGHHVAAARLYGGPFLDGVAVPGSVRFDRWRDGEADRYAALFLRVSRAACDELAGRGAWEERAAVARRWLEADPLDEDAALALLRALDAGGTTAGRRAALVAYDQFAEALRADVDAEPGAELQRLAAEVRERLASGAAAAAPVAAPVAPTVTPPAVVPPAPVADEADALLDVEPDRLVQRSTDDASLAWPTSQPLGETGEFALSPLTGEVRPVQRPAREAPPIALPAPSPTAPAAGAPVAAVPRRRWPRRVAIRAAVGLVLGAVLWRVGDAVAERRQRVAQAASPGAGRPVVAIVVDPGSEQARDSSLRWTADGLARMVADKLLRANDLVVLPPDRTRLAWAPNDSTAATAATVAERVGATIVVRGVLHREPDGLVLDVRVRDVAHDAAATATVFADASSFGLADRVAAHVLATAGAHGPGLRFAELETQSVEAYEAFMRGTMLIQSEQPGGIEALDHAIALDSNFVSALFERFQQAVYYNDVSVMRRVRERLVQVADRATERDRMSIRAYDAYLTGRHAVSESALRDVVARYPSDPRGYVLLAQVLRSHGKFAEGVHVLEQELAVAGAEQPGAACVTCRVEHELIDTYQMAGDARGAVAVALKAVAEHPTVPAAWWLLARMQIVAGQVADALESTTHALAMEGDTTTGRLLTGRAFIVGRRFEDADTVVRALLRGDKASRALAYDLRALLERERGQFRASTATIETSLRETSDGVSYEELGNHARVGDLAGVARVIRRIAPNPLDSTVWGRPLAGGPARGMSWRLGLIADALGERGDTAVLRAIADTLARVGPLSPYARDWMLPHHVRGLVAERAGQWAVAARELEQALYGRAGFTRTNAALGRAYLALHRPADALRVLRWAYDVELDAMGRYQPRSELDWLMAQAFVEAGQRDSASTYARYVRAAWAHADPEIRARLATLPP